MLNRRRALMSVGGGASPYQHGTWEDLFRSIDKGTYASEYAVGEILPLDLGTEGVVNAQIVAFDTDTIANSTEKAPVTFISKYVLNTAHRMNPTLSPSSAPYTEGTGAIGGWGKCEMRTYLKNSILPLIPAEIRERIVEVQKKSNTADTSGTFSFVSSTDDIWIPGAGEVFGDYSTEGSRYAAVFGTAGASSGSDKRVKTKAGSSTGASWWLRTAQSGSAGKFRMSSTSGSETGYNAQGSNYFIAIGFCIGQAPTDTQT